MNIRLGKIQIPIIATLLALLGLYILVSLGQWQLARADEKRAILAEMELRQTMDPISLRQLAEQSDKAYFHVTMEGQFDSDLSLYLDNRILNGRPGYEIIQPFKTGHQTILVNRGWIPLPMDRSQLPEVPNEANLRTITGIVYIPGEPLVLEEDVLSARTNWPKLIQALDMPKLQSLFGEMNLTVEPWILRQDPGAGTFYQRDWQYINMPPERHVSYAVTWFGLALALGIIYIAALLRLKEK
jgi:cytochrome oxidase assembly protein ShyY1